MERLLPKPREIDFKGPNVAVIWKKWKQNMEFCLTPMMRGKTGEENTKCSCSVFLYTFTVRQLFKNFEDYCLPKKNLVVARRKFIWKNQNDDVTFEQYMKDPKNLASTCEFGELYSAW